MSEGWHNLETKPPIGTKVHWTEMLGGGSSHFWGVVVRHTKTTVVIQVSPTRIVKSYQDPLCSSTTLEPTWDMQNHTGIARAHFIGDDFNRWCFGKSRRHASIEPYKEGSVGHNNSYY